MFKNQLISNKIVKQVVICSFLYNRGVILKQKLDIQNTVVKINTKQVIPLKVIITIQHNKNNQFLFTWELISIQLDQIFQKPMQYLN